MGLQDTDKHVLTHTTGRVHDELLLRARAVKNQAYVLAAAQGAVHANGRHPWGHSRAIGPWGAVQAVQAQGASVVLSGLHAMRVQQVRTQLPALTPGAVKAWVAERDKK